MGRIPDGRKFTTPGLGKKDYRSEHRAGFLADEGRRGDGYYLWEGKRRRNPRRMSTLIGAGLAVAVTAIFVYAIWGRQLLSGLFGG
ncbi:hypothetical protein [Arthrobacter roseus]|uniref:hypothetical protein n=1 Tax=Arthrobacter roseus TaxID=136274 RepID=UPI0019651000|nr:hypothetical protein [Arthrobacter roseus]MBM7847379.1 hypothetical protein [Arthrobacter roseus]